MEMTDWSGLPLDEVYAALFIDAIVVKVRDGQVASRPIYAALGVNLDSERDFLGLWACTGGAVKAREHFPSEQAALKSLYPMTRSLDPTGRGRRRWAQRWKAALNAFSITFAGRLPAADAY